MTFNLESAKAAGQKSKCGPSKLLDPNIKEKMKILYEGVLDDLIIPKKDNQCLKEYSSFKLSLTIFYQNPNLLRTILPLKKLNIVTKNF